MPITDVIAGHRYQTALAKQSAAGTAATVAEFAIPAYGGIVSPMENRTPFEILDGSAYSSGEFKDKAWSSGSVQFQSFPDSIGRLLTAHLGSDTMTGAGADKTHTIVFNGAPQWLTVWGQRPLTGTSVEWDRYMDSFIKSIELQYVAGSLFRAECEFLSRIGTVNVTAPTITTSNVLDAAGPYHTWAGADIKMDLATTPATTVVANLQSFTIKMSYDGADLLQTQNLTADFRDLQKWKVEMSGDFIVSDWAAYKNTFFGSATASNVDQSAVVTVGSLDVLVKTGPTVDALKSVQVKIPAITLSLEAPSPNVSGEGLKASMTGKLAKPASGAPVTAIVLNQVTPAY